MPGNHYRETDAATIGNILGAALLLWQSVHQGAAVRQDVGEMIQQQNARIELLEMKLGRNGEAMIGTLHHKNNTWIIRPDRKYCPQCGERLAEFEHINGHATCKNPKCDGKP